MRQAFAPLDDVPIERVFQPLSNALSGHLGVHRLRAASVCVELAAGAWVLSQTPDLSSAVLGWDAGAAFVHVILLMLGLTALLSLRRLFQRIALRAANPLRLTMRPHRAIVLLLLAARVAGLRGLGLAEAADMVMPGLATLALYLGACAEPPPRRRAMGLAHAA